MLALFQIPTGDYDDADEQEDRPTAKTNGTPVAKPNGTSPIKPVAVEPPVDPETGEVSPHLIENGDDMKWGALFVAAIKAAKTDAEIRAWMDVNCKRLDNVAIDAPKIHDRVMANIEHASEALKRAAA
jgi:hypothetical protein